MTAILLVLVPGSLATAARAQTCGTTRVSVTSSGAQGSLASYRGEISGNGRYVVFSSNSPELSIGPADYDILRHDRVTGLTELVSVSSSGTFANFGSEIPHVSANGRWVAFSSGATNLVPGDTNSQPDIFVHDCDSGATVRASVGNGGVQGFQPAFECAISADGRWVAFQSAATNLDALDTNGVSDVYLRDLWTGTTALVSIGPSGVGNSWSTSASVSGDGRHVAFESAASNFGSPDTNGSTDVYVKDMLTGTIVLASARPDGSAGSYLSDSPVITPDGRFVAFESFAPDLGPVPDSPYPHQAVYRRDLATSTTILASVSASGLFTSYQARQPDISDDGRFAVFEADGGEYVIGDTNGVTDIVVRDLVLGQNVRVSLSDGGQQGTNVSLIPSISADGQVIAFESHAQNLVTGDTNAASDVFVRACPTPAGSPFCFGDGSGTPCPCGNFGAVGSGCASPVSTQGGHLYALGEPSVASDTLLLRGETMSESIVTYFQGTTQANGGLGLVFGDGLVCAGGSIIRLGLKQNVGGTSLYPGPGDASIAVRGQIPVSGGVTRTYQVWYRTSAPYCTPATFNLTNGVSVLWGS